MPALFICLHWSTFFPGANSATAVMFCLHLCFSSFNKTSGFGPWLFSTVDDDAESSEVAID